MVAYIADPRNCAPKPSAEIYCMTCAELGAVPARAICIEDAAPMIANLRAEGMYTVGVGETLLGAHEQAATISDWDVAKTLAALKLTVETTRYHERLGALGTACWRLPVTNVAEVAFQQRKQISLCAALEDLGDKRPVLHEIFDRELSGHFCRGRRCGCGRSVCGLMCSRPCRTTRWSVDRRAPSSGAAPCPGS